MKSVTCDKDQTFVLRDTDIGATILDLKDLLKPFFMGSEGKKQDSSWVRGRVGRESWIAGVIWPIPSFVVFTSPPTQITQHTPFASKVKLKLFLI